MGNPSQMRYGFNSLRVHADIWSPNSGALLNMRRRVITCCLGFSICICASAFAESWMDTPAHYRRDGGAARLGPYPNKASCERVNASQFSGKGWCSSDAPSSAPAYSTGGYSGGSVQQQILGTMFSSFSQGFRQGLQNNAQGQQQQQAFERQMAEQRRALQAESERLSEQRRRQAAFEYERNQTQALLKGPKSTDSFAIKGAGDPQDLRIRESAPAHEARDVSTHWKRLHCAAYLSDLAQAAKRRGDEEEASYLTEQSGQVMMGGTAGVKCPDAPARPEVVSPRVVETPQDRFYRVLFDSTKESLDHLASVTERTKELQAKKDDAAKKTEDKRQQVERLKQAPQPPAQEAPASQQSVLDEALAALREAERAEQEADSALKSSLERQQQILESLDQKKSLYQEVERNPQSADAAIARIK